MDENEEKRNIVLGAIAMDNGLKKLIGRDRERRHYFSVASEDFNYSVRRNFDAWAGRVLSSFGRVSQLRAPVSRDSE